MAKNAPPTTITTVRDSRSGQFITVKGAGALKGKMTISKSVDLTKPISISSTGGKWTPSRGKPSALSASKGIAADHRVAKR